GSANNSDSSGDEYSIGYYSSESEQTCESVPKGKESVPTGKESVPTGKEQFVQFWNQICYLSDSDSSVDISDLYRSFGYGEYPKKEEKKHIPLIQKTWTMAEGKRVMVSSDECDSNPEMKEKKGHNSDEARYENKKTEKVGNG
ncbi:hypothetical protein MKW92_030075, partial [Papaver armeniacum]